MMKILVINSGSSSLKFQLFDLPDLAVSASGLIEQIGEEKSSARLTYSDGAGTKQMLKQSKPVAEHRQAIKVMAELLMTMALLLRKCVVMKKDLKNLLTCVNKVLNHQMWKTLSM